MTDSPNLDLVRSIYADWEHGEFSRTDWADPTIEYVSADGTEPDTWRGLAGMAAAWGNYVRMWERFQATVEECRAIDHERVLVLVHRSAVAKASGLEVEGDGADIWHLRGGRVTRFVIYWDRDRAFADLGFASDDDSAA